jgi:excisionase family DNA binding protein
MGMKADRYWTGALLALAVVPWLLAVCAQEGLPDDTLDLAKWPVVLTVADVQHLLRVSRGAAYDLCRSGALANKVLRVGRSIRIPRQAVAELLGAGREMTR